MIAGTSMHLPKESNPEDTYNTDFTAFLDSLTSDGSVFHEKSKVRLCPDCLLLGHESRLTLYQINFDEAMYLCPLPSCTYPMKQEDLLSSFIIKRNASSLQGPKSTSKKEKKCPLAAKKSRKLSSYSSFFDEFDADAFLSDFVPLHNKDAVSQSVTESSKRPVDVTEEVNNKPHIVSESKSNMKETFTEEQKVSTEGCLFDINDEAVIEEDLKMASNKSKEDEEILAKQLANVKDDIEIDVASPIEDAAVSDIVNGDTCTEELENVTTSRTIPDKYSKGDAQGTIINERCDIEDSILPRPSRHVQNIQWINKAGSCWLDAIITCLVNSVNLRAMLNQSNKVCLLKRLCLTYDHCQNIYQKNIAKEKFISGAALAALSDKLGDIRAQVFKALEERLSTDLNGFQSPLEMFPLVLKTGRSVEQFFKVKLLWEFQCDSCGHRRARRSTTHIVSFPCISADFHPLNAYFERPCFECKAAKGRMSMLMERLPPCLIFHFQNGLKHSNLRVLDFGLQGSLYSVFAVVQYLTAPTEHFITWIRDTKTNKWLRCDDLQGPVCHWQNKQPNIPPTQVHMVLWERKSVEDPKKVDFSCLSTMLNQEAVSIADDIPLELFYAHEIDEAIVLSEDEVLHDFNSLKKADPKKNNASQRHPLCEPVANFAQKQFAESPVDDAIQKQESNLYKSLDDALSNIAEVNSPEVTSASPNKFDPAAFSNSGISVYPDLNGMQTIQIIAPSNTCNIIIVAGDKQQQFTYKTQGPDLKENRIKKTSSTHSFLDKVQPFRKRPHGSMSLNTSEKSEVVGCKPKRHFRLAGYKSSHQKENQFAPLEITKGAKTFTANVPFGANHTSQKSCDKSDSEKWSEVSELSDLFPEFDFTSNSSSASTSNVLKSSAVTASPSLSNNI